MTSGTLIRSLILASWIGVTGWYAAKLMLPDLGLSPETDPRIALAARLNKVQHYAVLWRPQPSHAAIRVGSCSLGATLDDVGVRMETRVDLDDTRFVPGERFLRQAIDGRPGSGIRLRLDQMLDARMRLRRVEVGGAVFGVPFNAEGPVDHRGLALTWKAAGHEGTRLLPEVRAERLSGGELAANLPPNLKQGDSFTQRISSIDPVRLRLATKEARFTVIGRSRHRTAGGTADLLEVELKVDNRRFAILRCDDRGAVHRQELTEAGLILDLTHVTDQYGQQIWPVRPVASPLPDQEETGP